MRKNILWKGIMVISFTFLLTGCTVDYEMEIYNNKMSENIFIGEKNNANLENITQKKELEENINLTYDYWKAMQDDAYQLKKLFQNDKTGLEIRGQTELQPVQSLPTVNNCYTHFNIIETEDKYLISTSNKNLCFDYYDNLDVVNIHLSTNHKVTSNNADRVKNHTYTWVINRDNYEEKSIQIEMFKDKYVWNYKNRAMKKIVLSLVILIIILTISYVSYKIYLKSKKA